MTRKQAIFLAIQALSETGQNEEAIKVLHTISDELPLIHWSDAAIHDAVEQFIIDNGRTPTVSDFRQKGMPPHPVFKQKYGITLSEWLAMHYPVVKPSPEEQRERLTRAFKEEYLRIRPVSAEEYNAKRTAGSPCWFTVAIHNHTKRWRGLLETLELPIYNNINVPRETASLKVNIYTHYDFKD